MVYTLSVIKNRSAEFYQNMVGKTYRIEEVFQEKDDTETIILEEVPENVSKSEIYFSKEQIEEIVSKRKKGISLYKLAAEYQCSRTPIRRVLDIYMDKEEREVKSNTPVSLSEQERKEIIQKRKEGHTYQKLSEEYGYTPQGIKYICDKEKSVVKSNTPVSLSEQERKEIIQKRKEGHTYQKLSEEYGYTPQGIKYICDKEKNGII